MLAWRFRNSVLPASLTSSSALARAEFGIAPALAKRLLKESSYSQIIHTGANAGELIGALVVLIVGRRCVLTIGR